MTFGLAFWIIMFLWLVFSLAWNFNWGNMGSMAPLGNAVLLFILFLLLGWKVFGAPIH